LPNENYNAFSLSLNIVDFSNTKLSSEEEVERENQKSAIVYLKIKLKPLTQLHIRVKAVLVDNL
jgi:hypothetical protein